MFARTCELEGFVEGRCCPRQCGVVVGANELAQVSSGNEVRICGLARSADSSLHEHEEADTTDGL